MSRHVLTPDGAVRGTFVAGEWSEDAEVPKYPQRVLVAGSENGLPGYGVGVVPPGTQGRQVTGGQLVDGPWAYLYGRAGVIDTRGGTGAEVERERATGALIEAEAGDLLNLDGRDYLLVLSARRYPSLVLVTPELDQQAEVIKVAGMHLYRDFHG